MSDWQSMEYADSTSPTRLRLSVILPAYNHLDDVLRCFNSLQALAAEPHEYLCQDDCSPDVFYPELIPPPMASVERNEVNLGFAGNANKGAARATGDVLLFCNQDVQAVQGWSEAWDNALLAPFADPAVGIVAPRLLFPTGAIQSCGGAFDAFTQPIHRCLGYSNPHDPRVATSGPVEWATGAALAVRRDVFKRLGGFDTVFRMYFEDADLCLRAREAGYHVWYEPACTLVHNPGSTGGSPHFAQSARTFRDRWVTTGKVKAGAQQPTMRYW